MALQKPFILIAPLDWGFGHTIRSIPIIQEFIDLGCHVVVACNSMQKQLIEAEFPNIVFAELPGYDLHYGKSGWRTMLKIFLQLPKILIKVNREHAWLRRFLSDYQVDAIVSDNRFGFYSSRVPGIFITHQLAVQSGLGKWVDRFIRLFNFHYINKFSACWVPDFEGKENIAGALSHPSKKPAVPVHYIGPLSRLEPCPAASDKKIDLLVILSGPEPQRSILETIMINELKKNDVRTVLVRGLPGNKEELSIGPHVTVFNYVNSRELNGLMCSASLVCCRSGYTSIMDILRLQKRCIFIPTPGQAEQEYLAVNLYEMQLAFTLQQSQFDLKKALREVEVFPFKTFSADMNQYKKKIRELVESISP